MTAWPIILRELRAEARRPFIFWLRLLSAGIMLIIFIQMTLDDRIALTQLGSSLFPYLHSTLFFSTWLIVPLLTADCLARERREDTLILLLLTRLTPGGIVSAKVCVHALRAAMLILAALPVLCLPFLFGGVGATEALIAFFLEISAFLLALAAGLIATTTLRSWAGVMTLAALLGLGFGLLFCAGYNRAFQLNLVPCLLGSDWNTPLSWTEAIRANWLLVTGFNESWQTTLASAVPGVDHLWLALLWLWVNICGLFVVLCWISAAIGLKFLAVERPASLLQLQWQKIFCSPRYGARLFQGLRRRELERNPITWLQHYSWRGRAARLAWALGAAAAGWILAHLPDQDHWFIGHMLWGMLLLFAMAMAAARSWRPERQNGVWELLLITPLTAWQLIGGRTRGLYRHFSLAILVWLACLWFFSPSSYFINETFYLGLNGIAIFLVLPLVGQDSSLNLNGFWIAWLATAVPTVFAPGVVFLLARREDWSLLVLSGFILLVMAAMAGFGLYRQLALRQYEPRHRPSHRQLRKLVREAQRMGPPVPSER